MFVERKLYNKCEQKIKIQPSDSKNTVQLSFCEADKSHDSGLLYLTTEEAKTLGKELIDFAEKIELENK
jgi:hypothetical protein